MKRAIRSANLAIQSLGVVLAMAGSLAWAAPQSQQKNPPYTLAEYNAFKAQSAEQDTQVKIKLLDYFIAQYPDSALMPSIYNSYYDTYMSLRNYPQAVTYADKLLALAGKDDIAARLSALVAFAVAYSAGCDDDALRTPEAATKAQAAAEQGLQLVDQLQKPSAVSDATFTASRAYDVMKLTTAKGIAESRLKGDPVGCVAPPPPQAIDPGHFSRLIQDLHNEQSQIPRVR